MCTQCGATDDRRSWSSPEEAADEGAFVAPWACSTCAWTEFDLVEARAVAGAEPDPELERAHVAASVHDGGGSGVDPTFRTPA
jgi:hypothetical protein